MQKETTCSRISKRAAVLPQFFPGREQPTVVVALHSLFYRVQSCIVRRARALGWRIVDLRYYGEMLPSGLTPDGALVSPLWDEPLVRALQEVGCPIVRCGFSQTPHDDMLPAVIGDLSAAGCLAAEHFAERRFRHVAFLGGATPLTISAPAYEAFRLRAKELGCACTLVPNPVPSTGGGGWSEAEKLRIRRMRDQQFEAWLKTVPKPVGILVYSCRVAAKVCVGALDAGIKIPEEVALLALGRNPEACECAPVPLSSIGCLEERMGDAAVDLLKDIMAGRPAPTEAVRVPPSGVTLRESTDLLATSDTHVAVALRYMWDHIDLNLSVNDVACEVGVPRHTLERLFRKHLDRGINEELRRRRLEVFEDLLTSTDVPITELASRVGFRTMVHLQRSFRRAYGMTATQWRSRYGRSNRDGE